MKISKGMVLGILFTFVVVVVINLIGFIFSVHMSWMSFLFFISMLTVVFLVLKKSVDRYKLLGVLLGLLIIIVFIFILIWINEAKQNEVENALSEFAFIDVGGEEDSAVISLLGWSEKKLAYGSNEEIITYRDASNGSEINLNTPLLYDKTILKFDFVNEPTEFTLTDGENEYRIIPEMNLSAYDYTEQEGLYLYYLNPDVPRYETIKDFLENIDEIADKYTIGYTNNILDKYTTTEEDLPVDNEEFYYNGSMRGTHSFVMYVTNPTLNISFVKSDFNMYEGSDEFNITLKDRKGVIIYNNIIEDDGQKTKTSEKGTQNVDIILPDLSRDLYYLDMIYLGDGLDSQIDNLSINQKFVDFNKRSFLTKPYEFKANNVQAMKIVTWYGDKNRSILINGKKELINKKMPIEYKSSGENVYVIDDLGNTIISVNNYYSFPKNYFDVENLGFSNNGLESDYLILNYRYDGLQIFLNPFTKLKFINNNNPLSISQMGVKFE